MSVYEYEVIKSNGEKLDLSSFKGKKLLIVNTASKCGFTPQYDGLQDLYKKYNDTLEVLAFPCNQFGGQEPGSDEEITEFCSLNFNTTFPVMQKVDVNGENALPLFNYLKKELPGLLGTQKIKWNFTKFLVDENGKPIKRFAPKDEPSSIEEYLG